MSSIDDQVKNYALGVELAIELNGQTAVEKGTLKSVNWNKRTLVLHSRIYDADKTFAFDKISSIMSPEERYSSLTMQYLGEM